MPCLACALPRLVAKLANSCTAQTQGFRLISGSGFYIKLLAVWVIVAMTWEGAQVGGGPAAGGLGVGWAHPPGDDLRISLHDCLCRQKLQGRVLVWGQDDRPYAIHPVLDSRLDHRGSPHRTTTLACHLRLT